ncbi:MAG: ferredoxin family protein [Nitrospirae bacterium]|nr:ferredoxin family protein [Nitrospirota bacterium]
MKGKIIINRDVCKGCGYCIMACPKGVITLEKNFNAMGYYPACPVNIEKCNGCGLCSTVCPDIAIEVWRDEKETKFAENINEGQ